MSDYLAASIFVFLAVATAAALSALSGLLGPRSARRGKFDPYECGVPLLAGARERFHVKFYLVALLFVLFDIETVFLIPWAAHLRDLGAAAMVEAGVFIAVLALGLLYAIRRGIFRWDRDR